jgi:hypothetical protein
MLEQEARSLAALNHPNVATVYGLEEHEEHRYLVMELVDGETLDQRLSEGPLAVSEALEICGQIAEALEAAHDAGVVHRDVKPANVKISPSGLVKVLDFGLARADLEAGSSPAVSVAETLVSAGGMTASGAFVGTPQYMSPEQVRGERVDKRSDIWSWAVVLYECLTGIAPFARNSVGESIAAVLGQKIDLEALPASTPPVARAVLERCLKRDPRERLRDAGDVRRLLAGLEAARSEADFTAGSPVVPVEGRMRITDEICRGLDRDGFNAMLPGWEMQYADNGRESRTVIVWIPSFGGDHRTPAWRQLLVASPYRMIVPTLIGMEPGASRRPVVSLENQLALVRVLAADLKRRLRPERLIVSGFACGSVLALRCASGDESSQLFDGVLAIDADLQESDCFVSGLFSRLDPAVTGSVIDTLQQISQSCATVDEWIDTHEHAVDAAAKMRDNFEPLIRQGRDFTEPYVGVDTGAASPFTGWLRDAYERVATIRCVFHDSPENRRIIGEIRMQHLDDQCLGPKFTDETISFMPVSTHAGMLRTERLLEYLDLIVSAR